MPKIKDVTARGGLGGKAKEASARATFENEDVRITPSASYSSSKSNKKYNDDVSVDTSSKQSSVNLDGEMRVNKDIDLRAGLGRSKYSMDEKASKGGKDIGGYEEDSSSTRKSLGGRYKDLNVDYSEDKPSRGDTYKKIEGSYNIKNDEDEQLRVSGSTDSQKKSKVGIDYTLRFADGGVVPETERMLADGGMMQEGGTVDEASGNEVPAGSLKEEVRDDVDAKLSVGEFVVPADVVRYIGLENLMKMRDKAKAGLKQMSDIGQMGNAEEAVTDEEDVGEFSSAVDEVMGEEDEDAAFSSAVDETMNEEKDVRKMANGGYVQPENAATYANAPLKGFEMVSLVNDAGNVIYIPYVNGKPQLSIPSGYKVKTGAVDTSATAVAPVTPVAGGALATTTTSDSGGGGEGGGSTGGGSNTDGSTAGGGQGISSNAISAGLAGMAFGQSPLGKGLSAVIGLPVSTVANTISEAVVDNQIDAISSSMNAMNAAQTSSIAGQMNTVSDVNGNISTVSNQATIDAFDMATFGTTGSAAAATNAGVNAAAAAAANGMSSVAQDAASQAAAAATLGGATSSQAASEGAVAATNATVGENASAATPGAPSTGVGVSGAGGNAPDGSDGGPSGDGTGGE